MGWAVGRSGAGRGGLDEVAETGANADTQKYTKMFMPETLKLKLGQSGEVVQVRAEDVGHGLVVVVGPSVERVWPGFVVEVFHNCSMIILQAVAVNGVQGGSVVVHGCKVVAGDAQLVVVSIAGCRT
uniref:KOW domain-containing protein n=1 Tax=Globodera pallida TaxID=36090 RepID=A0A183BN03_GLOPA